MLQIYFKLDLVTEGGAGPGLSSVERARSMGPGFAERLHIYCAEVQLKLAAHSDADSDAVMDMQARPPPPPPAAAAAAAAAAALGFAL